MTIVFAGRLLTRSTARAKRRWPACSRNVHDELCAGRTFKPALALWACAHRGVARLRHRRLPRLHVFVTAARVEEDDRLAAGNLAARHELPDGGQPGASFRCRE